MKSIKQQRLINKLIQVEFENYKIRILEKNDTQSYFELIENNRPRLEDFISGIISKTKSTNDTEVFIDEIIEKYINKAYYPYVIIETINNEMIGFFDVKNIDWNIPKAEIGYFIDKNHKGKGIAKKALNDWAERNQQSRGSKDLKKLIDKL